MAYTRKFPQIPANSRKSPPPPERVIDLDCRQIEDGYMINFTVLRGPLMSDQSSFIARQRADGQAQALIAHLQGVAELAARFAGKWGAQQSASLVGYWHDLGKYRPGFQQYIREVANAHCEVATMPADKTHSGAGALLAQQQFAQHPLIWRVLAWMIASHHSGLRDWPDLMARLQDPKTAKELQEALAAAPAELLQQTRPDSKPLGGRAGFHLWLRMQFSALVDADFLDTEAFMDAEKFASRYQFPSLAQMQTRFAAHMQNLMQQAAPTPVNQIRAGILADCLAQASRKACSPSPCQLVAAKPWPAWALRWNTPKSTACNASSMRFPTPASSNKMPT